jgi:hypothetical protein
MEPVVHKSSLRFKNKVKHLDHYARSKTCGVFRRRQNSGAQILRRRVVEIFRKPSHIPSIPQRVGNQVLSPVWDLVQGIQTEHRFTDKLQQLNDGKIEKKPELLDEIVPLFPQLPALDTWTWIPGSPYRS